MKYLRHNFESLEGWQLCIHCGYPAGSACHHEEPIRLSLISEQDEAANTLHRDLGLSETRAMIEVLDSQNRPAPMTGEEFEAGYHSTRDEGVGSKA